MRAIAQRTGLILILAAGLALGAPGGARAASTAEPDPGCPGEDMPPVTFKAYVKGIQQELAVHGYDAGRPDGVPGPKTRRAIRHYQRDAGLDPNGCVSKELLDHLHFVLPKIFNRSPNADPKVVEAQTLLTRRGYFLGRVDGVVGYRTRAAVRQFEEDADLPVTGKVDRDLIEELKSADPSVRGDRPSSAAAR